VGHGTGAAVGGVSSLNFHSHIGQRLDGMMRPPKTEKLSNCEQAEEIKSQTRDGVTIARDTSHARRASQLLKHLDFTQNPPMSDMAC
jgi:hypothetical protein